MTDNNNNNEVVEQADDAANVTISLNFLSDVLTFSARTDESIEDDQFILVSEITGFDNDKGFLYVNAGLYQEIDPEKLN